MKSGSHKKSGLTSIYDLPPELLFEILFLLPPEKIQKINTTCKNFHDVCRSEVFWKNKYKQHFETNETETYGYAQFWQKYNYEYEGFSSGMKKLFSAVKENNLPKLKKLIKKEKIEINDLLKSNERITLIKLLTSYNTPQEIRNVFYENIIEPLSSKTGAVDIAGNTVLLWLFLLRQPVSQIKAFINTQNAIDVNTANLYGCTPLLLALKRQNLALVQLLLQHGANVNQLTFLTPLTCAVLNGNKEIITELIENGKVDVNLPDSNGVTPLMIAAEEGNLEVVQFLLENGALPNALDPQGATPLYFAAFSGNREIVQLFIKMGAHVNANTSEGYTPLTIAAEQGNLPVVAELLESGANINGDIQGASPLFRAVQQNQVEVAKLLIERGARDNSLNCTTSELNSLIETEDETTKARMQKFIDTQTKFFFGLWHSHDDKIEINALDLAHILGHQEIVACLEPEEEPGPFCKLM